MKLRALAAVRVACRAVERVLDAPTRIREGVRAVESRAEQLLDPPVVVIERVPTVPEYLQHRLASDEAARARSAALFAEVTEKLAAGAVRLEQLDAELFEIDPFN